MEYWEECVSQALDEVGISATQEQIFSIARDVEIAHEQYDMAHGYDAIPNPLIEENKRLKSKITAEKEKVICEICNGTGNITTHGPCHSGTSQCWKCRGEGRHSF